tara:strand:+ start:671 stop:901 length:231 start_codon:yes stop_codon:yes gene_type:complete
MKSNIFKTVQAARKLLKLLGGSSNREAKDALIANMAKRNGVTKTVLIDMARKKSASSSKLISRKKKYSWNKSKYKK